MNFIEIAGFFVSAFGSGFISGAIYGRVIKLFRSFGQS